MKKLFPTACKFFDQNIKLEEIGQNYTHEGLIGYSNSILDFFLARSKEFRLHAILHNSAGAVKATTNNGPGYCYMLPQMPSSCLLGHIPGLFFFIFKKILSSTYFPNVRVLKIFQKNSRGKNATRCTRF